MKHHKLTLMMASILGILLVLVSGVVMMSGSASAQVPAPHTKQAQKPQDVCETAWAPEQAPDPGPSYDTKLYTMSSVSANDIWAVGDQQDRSNIGTRRGYIVHWDGTTWSAVASPSVGQYPSDSYTSVAAIASDNVWVSGYSCGVAPSCTTLIMRWDGTQFNIVPSPNLSSVSNYLSDIAAISANDIWAVGKIRTATNTYSPLTLHWDGTSWNIVATPDLGSQSASLTTVAGVRANDLWAVGNYNSTSSGYVTHPIALHWNGTAWSIVAMPTPPDSEEVTVNGAAAISGNDVWAVGNYKYLTIAGAVRTLTYHWDGTAWSIVPSPNQYMDDERNYVNDISALGSNDIWAVGYWSNNGSGYADPLYLHWDGSIWTMPVSPYTSDSDGLGGVAMISPMDSWAVGYQRHGITFDIYNRPIIQRYYPRCYTPTPISTPTNTPTNTPIPPRCPGERFTDVCPGDYFYQPVLALNDAGVVSGYTTSPPCETAQHIPCFKPYNSSTRGQISKIVSLAARFSEPVSGQTFEDVLPASTFYQYIERMASRSIIVGYPCGGAGEPCNPPNNRPYFRPANTVSRGQLSKMVVGAFGFSEPVSGQVFEDVPASSTFYQFIGRIAGRGIISGYPCGGSGEPCLPPGNRPYFRPGNAVTRGQTAKIVNLSMTQPTATPTAPTATGTPSPLTPTHTSTSTSTSTVTATLTPTATPYIPLQIRHP